MINTITSTDNIKAILLECGLPTADISAARPPVFFGICTEGSLTAVIGLELFEDSGLLRSLAVLPTSRGRKLAQALVSHAERYALSRNIKSLFLLTETADAFFRKIGYQTAERNGAPQTIKSTAQFSGLCPASSSFLTKQLC